MHAGLIRDYLSVRLSSYACNDILRRIRFFSCSIYYTLVLSSHSRLDPSESTFSVPSTTEEGPAAASSELPGSRPVVFLGLPALGCSSAVPVVGPSFRVQCGPGFVLVSNKRFIW